ncbi:hypothetical protein QYH69_10185 [Paraburkholderia sp. SARCC-3016]|uniref:hypothetical protein n=1 Tax=Paraburkholderia sp. SARCC-3016 TaxID=3058611 RepID=UPI002806F18D|nr:hypothetical protein [Paraburkholderia sp. SARCC-3016]MDQ7977606.1 hypothetical protein [Paraburkholderia sp. SARCC-3016]
MGGKGFRRVLLNKVSILFVIGALIMSGSSAEESDIPVGEGFGFSSMNVMPDGANGVGVWLKGTARVRLSNTLNKGVTGKLTGVGVVEAELSHDDLAQAKVIHRKLCEAARRGPTTELEPMRPPLVYSITCMENGQLKPYHGQWHELPREVAFQLTDYQSRILKNYAGQGRAILKLNVAVASVQRQRGKLFVSVRFVNSGRYPILMSRPDTWRQHRDRLDVGAIDTDDSNDWGVDLAGVPIVNGTEFPDETLTIPAGGNVTFNFIAVPDKKIKRGTYRVGALVIAGIGGDGIAATMGRVGFTSDNSKPVVVTFDRDYPSTPEELENYEAQKREAMSSQPVLPGSEFAEDGYYRAVSEFNRQRSRFVTRFHKGDVAPEAETVIDENGEPIHDRLAAWFWEADPGLPPYGTDVVCRPGKACPRSGRWFERKQLPYPMFPVTYDDSSNRVIHCRAGEKMPEIVELSSHGLSYWEWIGI